MDLSFDITADDLGPAFKAWAANQALTRDKTAKDLLYKVMKFWVSFVQNKIPKGDKGKVQAQLMTLTQAYSRIGSGRRARLRGGKRANELRGTIAAAIVATLNYRGARLKAAFGDDAGFYADVRRFIAARKFSVNLHRFAGFIPALEALGRLSGATGPRYRHAPGSFSQTLTGEVASILVENAASAAQRPGRPAPLGVRGLAGGDPFAEVLPQLQALIIRFAAEDGVLTDSARTAGFAVNTGNPSRAAA